MKTKAVAIKKILTIEYISIISMFFLSFFAPLFGVQAITGPLVNAVLFLATFLFGIKIALWFAIFPSIIALFVGMFPIFMAPMIPVIIMGNVVLVIVFNAFKDNFWKSVFLASISKYLVLSVFSFLFINYLIKSNVPSAVSMMFTWPQLLTAIMGGIIAYIVLNLIRSIKR